MRKEGHDVIACMYAGAGAGMQRYLHWCKTLGASASITDNTSQTVRTLEFFRVWGLGSHMYTR